MSCACRMEQPKPNEPCFVFDLHDACLFEECAWQVELFFLFVTARLRTTPV